MITSSLGKVGSSLFNDSIWDVIKCFVNHGTIGVKNFNIAACYSSNYIWFGQKQYIHFTAGQDNYLCVIQLYIKKTYSVLYSIGTSGTGGAWSA